MPVGVVAVGEEKNPGAPKYSANAFGTVSGGNEVDSCELNFIGDDVANGDGIDTFIGSTLISVLIAGLVETTIRSSVIETIGDAGRVVDEIVLSWWFLPSHGRNNREYVCGGGEFEFFVAIFIPILGRFAQYFFLFL